MHQGESARAQTGASRAHYAVAFILALIVLLPRLDGFSYFHGKYMWAEDGPIFIGQAQDLGLASITQPYAGYIHLFPRLVTQFSNQFALAYQPAILLLGWLLAYFVMVYALASAAVKNRMSIAALGLLVPLVSLQPNYGEVFFNITNSQWMIGAALCVFVLADAGGRIRSRAAKGILLFPLALTGPFSIILAPMLALKAWIRKDWDSQKYVYLSVFAGALIQFIVLSSSGRASSGEINDSFREWLTAFFNMAVFGAAKPATVTLALLFWILVASLIYIRLKSTKFFDFIAEPPALLLIAAFLLIWAGLFSHKDNPASITAPGGGNRYTWVPYVLVLTSACMLSHGRKKTWALMCLSFAIICLTNFHRVKSSDLQFEAFARYSEVRAVHIPIHPHLPTFPGWHVDGKPRDPKRAATGTVIEISPLAIQISGAIAHFSNGQLKIAAAGNDPNMEITQRLHCSNSSFAGITISLSRAKEGWLQLFWSKDSHFSEDATLRRWYPSGSVHAQFAFPVSSTDTSVRFDPMDGDGQATIEKIEFHCL